MRRWVLVLVLTVAASPPLWAQPAPPSAVTVQAHGAATAADRRVMDLTARRNGLLQRQQERLAENARLKQQKRSWRTDRLLQEGLAEANENAAQLAVVTRELGVAQAQLAKARGALVAAIDAELEAAPVGPRADQLRALRTRFAPAPRTVHRIMLPDTKIDQHADPEELDEQAAAILESETELQRQVAALDAQGKELDRVAELRKQHDRAKELDQRDDQNPRRTSNGSRPSTELGLDSAPPPADRGPTLDDAITQLVDVVDVSITNDLTRAQRSGDPAQRALAAKKARDAVAARLDVLKKKRAEIERLAKQKRRRSQLQELLDGPPELVLRDAGTLGVARAS